MNATAYQRILDALRERGSTVRPSGERSALAQCPAHEDRNPSLSVRGQDQRARVHCFAGCEDIAVLTALGMDVRDLFDTPGRAEYRYLDRLVTRMVHLDGRKTFRQTTEPGVNGHTVLYRLDELRAAVAAGQPVFLVEGEDNSDALASLGAVATSAPMGAGSFGRVDVEPLRGAHVIAVVDNDEAGRRWAECVAQRLTPLAANLRFVRAAGGLHDAGNHVAAGHALDDFEPLDDADRDTEDADERARRMFPRIDWHSLWADEADDEWLHVPLLPARRSVVIYSAPKVGKSLLALEFAVALSRAERFLGHQIERRVRVLYVDFENDPRGDVRSRLQAMGYGPDDLARVDYLSFPSMAGLDTERGSLELLEAVRAYGSEVVIIDTVSRAVDGEENSNDTWLGLYRHTGLKLKQAAVAMVRLDHSGKDESKGQRGGSAKSGDVDAVWRLIRVTDERLLLECTASRMEVATKALHLTRHRVPRLHHTADVLGGLTDHEAKVAHLVRLCDANGLPADANRDAVRVLARSRGFASGTDVIREVIKRRKADLNPQVSGSRNQGENRGPAVRSPQVIALRNRDSEHKRADLNPSGQPGSVGQADSDLRAAVRSTALRGQAGRRDGADPPELDEISGVELGDDPPAHEVGPCVRCGTLCHRYGELGSALCPACEERPNDDRQ